MLLTDIQTGKTFVKAQNLFRFMVKLKVNESENEIMGKRKSICLNSSIYLHFKFIVLKLCYVLFRLRPW